MRLLIIADGRSLNTKGWLKTLSLKTDISVHLISSYPAPKIEGLASQHTVPVAFGALGGTSRKVGKINNQKEQEKSNFFRKFIRAAAFLRDPLMKVRYLLGPLTIPRFAKQVERIVKEVNPDIIHGLRIPFEGMLAYTPNGSIPTVVSIWGNDLTLHANGSFLMRKWTKRVLENCDALIADTARDIDLAKKWGLANHKPTLVVPGGGGIPLAELPEDQIDLSKLLGETIDPERPLIINPRGFRPGSVRNDTFFKAIPEVVSHFPNALFLCPPMAGEPKAEAWVKELGIEAHVRLLPLISQREIWGLFKRAQITTSISEHDGTPNSLIEAMACGSYPIAGNIESSKEWIEDGKNGRLVDPANPKSVAIAIIEALNDNEHREMAAIKNVEIIGQRASRSAVADAVETFYQSVLK